MQVLKSLFFCLFLVLCTNVSEGKVIDRKSLARALINSVIFGSTEESRNILEDLDTLPPITAPEFINELTKQVKGKSNFAQYFLLPDFPEAKNLARPLTDSFFLSRDYQHMDSLTFDNNLAKTLLGNAVVLLVFQKRLTDQPELHYLGVQNIRNLNTAYETLILSFVESAQSIFKKIRPNSLSNEIFSNFDFTLNLLEVRADSKNLSESLYQHFRKINESLDKKLGVKKVGCFLLF